MPVAALDPEPPSDAAVTSVRTVVDSLTEDISAPLDDLLEGAGEQAAGTRVWRH